MIKDIILKTGAFIDNEYLDKYLNIISSSADAGYSEKHHIIPQKYFKLLGISVDNSATNIIKLSAYNHIYAHYLLCFCTIGKLNKSCIKAFLLMTQYNKRLLTTEECTMLTNLNYYAELRMQAQTEISTANSEQFKGRKMLETTKQKISAANKGRAKPPRTAEHLANLKQSRDLHATTIGRKSIYNKELNQVKFVYESELSNYLDTGWVLGGKPLSDEAKQKIGKGNSIALKGKTHQVKKTGQTNSGLIASKIECVETGQVFETMADAKKWLQVTTGIMGSQIKNCCTGAREMTGGYHWRYIK